MNALKMMYDNFFDDNRDIRIPDSAVFLFLAGAGTAIEYERDTQFSRERLPSIQEFGYDIVVLGQETARVLAEEIAPGYPAMNEEFVYELLLLGFLCRMPGYVDEDIETRAGLFTGSIQSPTQQVVSRERDVVETAQFAEDSSGMTFSEDRLATNYLVGLYRDLPQRGLFSLAMTNLRADSGSIRLARELSLSAEQELDLV